MICRTCEGTGKVKRPPYCKSALPGDPFGVEKPIRKMCPDCYGSGKVINKGKS